MVQLKVLIIEFKLNLLNYDYKCIQNIALLKAVNTVKIQAVGGNVMFYNYHKARWGLKTGKTIAKYPLACKRLSTIGKIMGSLIYYFSLN